MDKHLHPRGTAITWGQPLPFHPKHESLALRSPDSFSQPLHPAARQLGCEGRVPPCLALSLLLQQGFEHGAKCCPDPPGRPQVNSGMTGCSPGWGSRCVTEPRGPGVAAHHSLLWPQAHWSHPHGLLSGAELAVSGFVFQFSKQRRTLCAMKTGHTWGSPRAGGGVQMPVGNVPSPWKPTPWGSLWPRSLTRGQLQASCARAPHKETGNVSLSSTANTAARSTLLRPSLVAQRPQGAPRPPCWAGPKDGKGQQEALKLHGEKGQGFRQKPLTWTKGL